jgi:RimJ/RimL family protein N-acetyltransferase
MLCVDEKYRGLGLAGRMEKATEEFILEKVTRQDPAARIVLIITHEADNVASARAHDKLGYQSLGTYVNPKYSNIKLSIRAKVLNA